MKKGFERKNSHHKMLVLRVDGRLSHIRTRISHSDPEYRGDLLSAVKKQLGGLSNDEFEDLVECPMTLAKFLDLLAERGVIQRSNTQSKLRGAE